MSGKLPVQLRSRQGHATSSPVDDLDSTMPVAEASRVRACSALFVVGPEAPLLLFQDGLSCVRGLLPLGCSLFALVRDPVALVGDPVTLVRRPVSEIRAPVALIRDLLPLVRDPVALVRRAGGIDVRLVGD
jgi:hypothetical protein